MSPANSCDHWGRGLGRYGSESRGLSLRLCSDNGFSNKENLSLNNRKIGAGTAAKIRVDYSRGCAKISPISMGLIPASVVLSIFDAGSASRIDRTFFLFSRWKIRSIEIDPRIFHSTEWMGKFRVISAELDADSASNPCRKTAV